jgi:hypothetical protein
VAFLEHERERTKSDVEKEMGVERWQACQVRRKVASVRAVKEKMGVLLKELSAGAAMKKAAHAAKLELQNDAPRRNALKPGRDHHGGGGR